MNTIYQREHATWWNMLYRPERQPVCARWRKSFWSFLYDMGRQPAGFRLDLIDQRKGFSPQNCRWLASAIEMRWQRYPKKTVARTMVRQAIKTGSIKKMPCEICGDPIAWVYISDTQDPLKVRWFCEWHHREEHVRRRRLLRLARDNSVLAKTQSRA